MHLENLARLDNRMHEFGDQWVQNAPQLFQADMACYVNHFCFLEPPNGFLHIGNRALQDSVSPFCFNKHTKGVGKPQGVQLPFNRYPVFTVRVGPQ